MVQQAKQPSDKATDQSPARAPADLRNHGLLELHGQPVGSDRTVLVVGVARSGTSMIANILVQLGLFMGNRRDGIVFEDVDLAEAFESKRPELAQQIINERNAAHQQWGWKRPEAFKYLSGRLNQFRNPCLIVTFRDILAIGLRNIISSEIKPEIALRDAQARYAALLKFVESVSVPTLLISYEKALLNAPETIEKIADFAGLRSSEDTRAAALNSIELDRPEYLQGARVRHILGHVGNLREGRLYGWAKSKSSDKPISVTVNINGTTVVTELADVQRPDLINQGIGDGCFGFVIDLRDHLKGSSNSVRVFESSTGEELGGSPKTFQAPTG